MNKQLSLKSVIFQLCLIAAMSLAVSPVFAQESLPQWEPGSWWNYTTTFDVHMQQEGSLEYADLVMIDTDTRYEHTVSENRTLTHGSALTYFTYVQTYSGSVTAEGTYHVEDPFPIDFPVELRNGTISGELWTDSATLAQIYLSRTLSGQLWAYFPFQGWSQVGTVSMNIEQEYEPPRDAVHFPLQTGNTWNLDITAYSFGSYEITYDFGSGPQTVSDTFDENGSFTFQVAVTGTEDIGGLFTYRSEANDATSGASFVHNYAPAAANTAYEQVENFNVGGSSQLNSYERTLGNFYLEPVSPTPIPCLHTGDIDGSESITPQDALATFQIYLGAFPSPTETQLCAADCNDNTSITPEDALCIFLHYLSGSCSCVDPL